MKKYILLLLILSTIIFSGDLGMWKTSYYTDSYGDKTEDYLVMNKENIYGGFSNSATTNSKLKVKFLIDSRKEIDIKLYEYGSYLVKDGSIRIGIKRNGEELYRAYALTNPLVASNHTDRFSLNRRGSKKLFDILELGGDIKFYIVETGNYASASYWFEINADGFKNAMKELQKLEGTYKEESENFNGLLKKFLKNKS